MKRREKGVCGKFIAYKVRGNGERQVVLMRLYIRIQVTRATVVYRTFEYKSKKGV
jgi:hypothetical protein